MKDLHSFLPMRSWEQMLIRRSADLLCESGGEFLEVGLGHGYSALRIADRADTYRHTVIEKYAKVIELFRAGHPKPPPTLEIIEADILDYVHRLRPSSYDGVVFAPELAGILLRERMVDAFMPRMVRALRAGATFVPMFPAGDEHRGAVSRTTSLATVLECYLRFFDRVVVERHRPPAPPGMDMAPAGQSDAFIVCFTKD